MTTQSKPVGKVFLTLREAADYANCSPITLRRQVHAKALPHHRIGSNERRGKIFIKIADLEKFIEGCRFEAVG